MERLSKDVFTKLSDHPYLCSIILQIVQEIKRKEDLIQMANLRSKFLLGKGR